jgi:Fe-S cluster assembly protein SufD
MTPTLQAWKAAHRAFAGNGSGGAPAWLRELREAGMDRFATLGFPTTKQEEWRFTNVAAIVETAFVLPHAPRSGAPSAKEIRGCEVCEAGRHLLVFVNGRYSGALSSVKGLPDGVVVGSLWDAIGTHGDLVRTHLGRLAATEGRPFAALNTAFVHDGGFVHVPAGVQMTEPVQFLYLTVPGAEPIVSHPRSLVVAEGGARCAIVESYIAFGDGVYLTNAVTEIVAGDGARVDCYRVQRESVQAYHVGATATRQGRDSTVNVHPVTFGAALTRHDINVVMAGENGLALLNGLYVLGGRQHADHHTTIDHAEPHCESHEYFNGVLDERSHGVFNGRIIVRPGAQRTDSKQTNNNLVLSEDARADSQPQLEIYADDVKCTHGATLGPIDEQAMFYLKSRGVPPAEARSLLTYGFGAEIIDRMGIAPLQAQLDRWVRQRLLGTGAQAA